jgi:hypothetical protein
LDALAEDEVDALDAARVHVLLDAGRLFRQGWAVLAALLYNTLFVSDATLK